MEDFFKHFWFELNSDTHVNLASGVSLRRDGAVLRVYEAGESMAVLTFESEADAIGAIPVAKEAHQ